MPTYDFNDFKNACNDKNKIFIPSDVLEDAKQLNLDTKEKLREFINNNGLEDLKFINAKPWDNNPDKSKDIMVDAYEFRSLYILGYIAFFYNEKTEKWIIKSFKRSENSNMAMNLAFKKAILKIENKSGEKNE